MPEWKEIPLSELTVSGTPITYGVVKPGPEDPNGVLLIRGGDILGGRVLVQQLRTITREVSLQYSRTLLKGGEIVVSLVGNPGQVAIVPVALKGANIARQVGLIRLREGIDVQFVKYYLSSRSGQEALGGRSIGSVQQVINLADIRTVRIPLPPLQDQRAIASVLSSLDDKIDLLYRQNGTLEALAETLFWQWFVEEGDGWKDGVLGDLIELVYGKGLKEEIRTGEGYPVVGSSGVVGYHSEFLVEGPGIVIGRKGTLGRVNYMFENFFPIDTTYYVESKLESKGMFYEYFLLKTLGFEDFNSDSAVPGLNREIALATEIKIAPASDVESFNNFCEPLFEKVYSNNNQIRTLTQLRDTLLPKLMNGDLNVLT